MTLQNKWGNHPRVFLTPDTADEAKGEVRGSIKVTDEVLERRRERTNKPYKVDHILYNTEASKDTIRHFADGIGDGNPLFRDEDYAKNTKYGKIIAPGCYLYTIQWVAPGSGMPGIHAWYSGGDWEWYKPILVGDQFKSVAILRDVLIKDGKMTGGGKIYIDQTDVVYVNQKGEIAGKELQRTIWAEREASGSAGKYIDTAKPVISKEDWIRILSAYESEEVRGSTPRYWEDVQVGDRVGPMIKGPLSVRDEIAWLMGGGSPFFRAHKIEFDFEARHPKVLEYVKEMGEADVPELVHIFDEWARHIGVARAYDYGNQRMAWLCNFFTNWTGDDGFLWKMSGDLRSFNQMGDVVTFEGKVIKKYIDEGKCCVDIEAWAKNQRDQWSMRPRTSTVILPSKEHGAVKYPEPTPKLVEEVKSARIYKRGSLEQE